MELDRKSSVVMPAWWGAKWVEGVGLVGHNTMGKLLMRRRAELLALP